MSTPTEPQHLGPGLPGPSDSDYISLDSTESSSESSGSGDSTPSPPSSPTEAGASAAGAFVAADVRAGSPGAAAQAAARAANVRNRAQYFERLLSSPAAVASTLPHTPRHSEVHNSPFLRHPLQDDSNIHTSVQGGQALDVLPHTEQGGGSDQQPGPSRRHRHHHHHHHHNHRRGNSHQPSDAAAAPQQQAADLDVLPQRQANTNNDSVVAAASASSSLEMSSLRQHVEPCTSGYVRTIAARFQRQSSLSSAGVRGVETAFDELVAQVTQLIASSPQGEAAQLAAAQAVSDKLQRLQDATEGLMRKEEECEHLHEVMRELTATRAEAIQLKAAMAESFNGLQSEYYRVLRMAHLAQAASRQSVAKAATARKALLEAQSEAHKQKKAAAAARDKARRLRSENEELRLQLAALERLQLGADDVRTSVCYRQLLREQAKFLY